MVGTRSRSSPGFPGSAPPRAAGPERGLASEPPSPRGDGPGGGGTFAIAGCYARRGLRAQGRAAAPAGAAATFRNEGDTLEAPRAPNLLASGVLRAGRPDSRVDARAGADYMAKQMLREHTHEHPEGEAQVGILLAAVRRRIRQVVRAEAGSHRLSPQQFWSLVGIGEAGPLSLGALADRLRMDQPTASRVIQSLTKRRLVRLAEDPVDRRRLLIDATPEGQALAAKIRPVARDLRLALVEGFSAAELAALRGALLKIVGNLDRFEARRARRPARAAQAREEHA